MFSLATAFILAVLPVSAAPSVHPFETPEEPPKLAALPAWWTRVNAGPPGAFPAPRPFKASYGVTWEGLEAAHFDTDCTLPDGGSQISTSAKVHTTGVARTLFKLDATHLSIIDRKTLKPLRLEQTEDEGHEHSVDKVEFTPQFATRTSAEHDAKGKERQPKPRRYDYPGLFDMESAFLYMRSLPLAVGETRTLALMTSGSPYLATIKVVGQGRVQVKAGDFPAFEYALSLEKITKNGTLEPRKGFKSAHAWVSDDANRIIIKAQADVFVGSVTVELDSIQFADAAAQRTIRPSYTPPGPGAGPGP